MLSFSGTKLWLKTRAVFTASVLGKKSTCSVMRVKETCFSETLACIHQITLRHFVDDNILSNFLIDVLFSSCIN